MSELDGVRDSLCKDSVVGPGLCTELAGAGGLEFWSSGVLPGIYDAPETR